MITFHLDANMNRENREKEKHATHFRILRSILFAIYLNCFSFGDISSYFGYFSWFPPFPMFPRLLSFLKDPWIFILPQCENIRGHIHLNGNETYFCEFCVEKRKEKLCLFHDKDYIFLYLTYLNFISVSLVNEIYNGFPKYGLPFALDFFYLSFAILQLSIQPLIRLEAFILR